MRQIIWGGYDVGAGEDSESGSESCTDRSFPIFPTRPLCRHLPPRSVTQTVEISPVPSSASLIRRYAALCIPERMLSSVPPASALEILVSGENCGRKGSNQEWIKREQ